MSTVIFLHPTRHTYYRRVQIPKNIRQYFKGKVEVWRSLKTADKDQASVRAAQFDAETKRLFVTLKRQGEGMTKDQIEALVQIWLETEIDELEDSLAVGGPVSDDQREGEWIVYSDLFDEASEAHISRNFRKVECEADALLASAGLGELTFQQGTTIRPDPDFRSDMDRIIHALEAHGIKPQPVARPDLEIVSVRCTPDFELDVTLRNIGSEPAVIHQIDLTLVEDHGGCVPIIRPSAKYDMPIGNLREGETRSLPVSHYVEPHGVDRFKIALHTTRSLLLRLTLHYNKDQKAEASANT